MSDLKFRFGLILALALLPVMILCILLGVSQGHYGYLLLSLSFGVFAYFAIWFAIDKMVFSHLRTIKSASDIFSTGQMDMRVGDIVGAPNRIQDLGAAFDHMAENISERENLLLDNLQEKETLLREIHHRVKNNLQIIISLLNMQERKLKDAKGLAAIQETRSRVNAIALVHRGLYEGNDLRVIDMPDFLSRLVDELKVGLVGKNQNVSIDTLIDPLKLEADRAIPIALFIVEALTNAIKHGVKAGGDIQVILKKTSSEIRIAVKDNGVGVPTSAAKGTGSKLMQGFARQLSGVFSQGPIETGYKVSLCFQPNPSEI